MYYELSVDCTEYENLLQHCTSHFSYFLERTIFVGKQSRINVTDGRRYCEFIAAINNF